MFRFLILLILAGVVAYYTNPAPAVHEAQARALIEAQTEAAAESGNLLEQAAGYIKGAFAGDGRYDNFFLASRYTLDMPGSSYVECWGVYTLVRCSVVEAGGS